METARLLLADDHAVVRAGIANAIADLPGVQIVGEVGDGPAVFAALADQLPDCLLIDVTMPNFEPIGDIGQIRATYPHLKILVVSAYDDDVYVQGLLGAGVNGYHLKDQPLSDLRLAVQRVLAGERWICSPLVEKLVRLREGTPVALTERQRELLVCLQEGLDNLAIARRTDLSVKTVENHLTRLYRHLGVQSRLEAVRYIRQHPAILGRAALPAGAPARAEPERQNTRLALLIVDDNTRYRAQLRRQVERAYPGAIVYEAENILAALRHANAQSPRLALVDVVLGDESGIDCARKLHTLLPTTRIVLFSAYPDREFHRQGLQAGAVAFLDKKDLDAAALRELIDDVLA
jgi:DNA-binding NarL/FixJ family response regulator